MVRDFDNLQQKYLCDVVGIKHQQVTKQTIQNTPSIHSRPRTFMAMEEE